MEPVVEMVKIFTMTWLILAIVIIFYRLLTGIINTTGLLRGSPNGPVIAQRVQLLAVTIFALITYVANTIDASQNGDVIATLEVPSSLLAVFGGSQFIYLFDKVAGR